MTAIKSWQKMISQILTASKITGRKFPTETGASKTVNWYRQMLQPILQATKLPVLPLISAILPGQITPIPLKLQKQAAKKDSLFRSLSKMQRIITSGTSVDGATHFPVCSRLLTAENPASSPVQSKTVT